MTRDESWNLLGCAGGMSAVMRGRPLPDAAMTAIRDRLLELAGAIKCAHCDGKDNSCPHCVHGWDLPELVL